MKFTFRTDIVSVLNLFIIHKRLAFIALYPMAWRFAGGRLFFYISENMTEIHFTSPDIFNLIISLFKIFFYYMFCGFSSVKSCGYYKIASSIAVSAAKDSFFRGFIVFINYYPSPFICFYTVFF